MLARMMALKFDAVKCIHLNYLPAPANGPKDENLKTQVKPHEQRSLDRSDEFQRTGRAYGIAHGTRPGTIGMASTLTSVSTGVRHLTAR